MASQIPSTHKAVVTPAPRAPLKEVDRDTQPPKDDELLVKISWLAATPLSLHMADGWLLVTQPTVLSGATLGVVVAAGPEAKRYKPGDRVFGYTFSSDVQRPMQQYVTAKENMYAKVVEGMDERAIVTVSDSFVTAWHTISTELKIPLPWPRPEGYTPEEGNEWFVVWGGSSSVGQYTLQVLKYYGFKNVIALASEKHHDKVREWGATEVADYRDPKVSEKIMSISGGKINYILDCIGSQDGTIKPIAQFAPSGSHVAIMLPVIIRDATDEAAPEYEMDVTTLKPKYGVQWQDGVDVIGVRTHFYLKNEFNAEHLQPDIMHALLQSGDIKPSAFREINGGTLVERAQEMLDLLRARAVSGERLVLRVNEED